MYTLEVKNPCRCFIRDGGLENQTFASKQEAHDEANLLLERMQKNYCKKHQFILSQNPLGFTITIQPRN